MAKPNYNKDINGRQTDDRDDLANDVKNVGKNLLKEDQAENEREEEYKRSIQQQLDDVDGRNQGVKAGMDQDSPQNLQHGTEQLDLFNLPKDDGKQNPVKDKEGHTVDDVVLDEHSSADAVSEQNKQNGESTSETQSQNIDENDETEDSKTNNVKNADAKKRERDEKKQQTLTNKRKRVAENEEELDNDKKDGKNSGKFKQKFAPKNKQKVPRNANGKERQRQIRAQKQRERDEAQAKKAREAIERKKDEQKRKEVEDDKQRQLNEEKNQEMQRNRRTREGQENSKEQSQKDSQDKSQASPDTKQDQEHLHETPYGHALRELAKMHSRQASKYGYQQHKGIELKYRINNGGLTKDVMKKTREYLNLPKSVGDPVGEAGKNFVVMMLNQKIDGAHQACDRAQEKGRKELELANKFDQIPSMVLHGQDDKAIKATRAVTKEYHQYLHQYDSDRAYYGKQIDNALDHSNQFYQQRKHDPKLGHDFTQNGVGGQIAMGTIFLDHLYDQQRHVGRDQKAAMQKLGYKLNTNGIVNDLMLKATPEVKKRMGLHEGKMIPQTISKGEKVDSKSERDLQETKQVTKSPEDKEKDATQAAENAASVKEAFNESAPEMMKTMNAMVQSMAEMTKINQQLMQQLQERDKKIAELNAGGGKNPDPDDPNHSINFKKMMSNIKGNYQNLKEKPIGETTWWERAVYGTGTIVAAGSHAVKGFIDFAKKDPRDSKVKRAGRAMGRGVAGTAKAANESVRQNASKVTGAAVDNINSGLDPAARQKLQQDAAKNEAKKSDKKNLMNKVQDAFDITK